MRSKCIFLKVSVIFLLLVIFFVYVTAETELPASIITKPISENEKQYYIDELKQQFLDGNLKDFQDRFVVEFDVSDNGMLAIGLDNLTILICNSQAEVQCAFSFRQRYSNIYYLNWVGDSLQLILNRSNGVYLFDSNGNLLEVAEQDPWDTQNREALNTISWRNTVAVNDNTYEMRKTSKKLKWAGEHYDCLVCTSSNGEETIIFQSTAQKPAQIKKANQFLIFFAAFIALIMPYCIIKTIRRSKRGTDK